MKTSTYKNKAYLAACASACLVGLVLMNCTPYRPLPGRGSARVASSIGSPKVLMGIPSACAALTDDANTALVAPQELLTETQDTCLVGDNAPQEEVTLDTSAPAATADTCLVGDNAPQEETNVNTADVTAATTAGTVAVGGSE